MVIVELQVGPRFAKRVELREDRHGRFIPVPVEVKQGDTSDFIPDRRQRLVEKTPDRTDNVSDPYPGSQGLEGIRRGGASALSPS